jgi:hypothetical protein
MKTANRAVVLAGMATLLALPGKLCAQEEVDPAHGQHSVRDVEWLTGCWEISVAGFTAEEHWMPPRGGMMLGLNRTIRSGRKPSYEFLILRESESGLTRLPPESTPEKASAAWISCSSG